MDNDEGEKTIFAMPDSDHLCPILALALWLFSTPGHSTQERYVLTSSTTMGTGIDLRLSDEIIQIDADTDADTDTTAAPLTAPPTAPTAASITNISDSSDSINSSNIVTGDMNPVVTAGTSFTTVYGLRNATTATTAASRSISSSRSTASGSMVKCPRLFSGLSKDHEFSVTMKKAIALVKEGPTFSTKSSKYGCVY